MLELRFIINPNKTKRLLMIIFFFLPKSLKKLQYNFFGIRVDDVDDEDLLLKKV